RSRKRQMCIRDSPKIALFSSGYRNRFGHPKPKILERYRQRNVRIWQTVDKGAISLRVLNDGISAIKPDRF
ncbi:hypothetical protein, partial [Candidatus Marithrix sp. Canyon 246]|uniref:hypothetical protein n=1 Tax=Candidatus Marithrix sp. Canyon 246 TaxID=1827136 RepID=UPI000ADA1C2C